MLQPGAFGFALALGENMEAVSVDINMDTSLLHTIIKMHQLQKNQYNTQMLMSVMMDDADVKDNRARFY